MVARSHLLSVASWWGGGRADVFRSGLLTTVALIG